MRLLVEEAVDAVLDDALEGIEDEAGDDDGGDEAPLADVMQAGVDDFGDEGDDAEVEADEGGGGEGVGDAALEDEVDVHEAVADDGPAEGEGQQDQREQSDLGEGAGHVRVEKEGNDVERGEGKDGEDRAAREPLELLALEGLLFIAIADPEDDSGEEVEAGEVGVVELVEAVLELRGRGPEGVGEVAQDAEDYAGDVEERIEKLAAAADEHSVKLMAKWRKSAGWSSKAMTLPMRMVSSRPSKVPVILEGVEDEGDEAEDVEVGGLGAVQRRSRT